MDTTANQESYHVPGTPPQNADLRGMTWTQLPGGGVRNRYFAIPDSRAGHRLIYGVPNSVQPVSQSSYSIGTYANGTSGAQVPLGWRTAFATEPANSAVACIVDRTTDEKAAAGATDVRAASAWSFDPDYAFYPLVAVQVWLEAREVGHKFTVHGWVPGAPVQKKYITAAASGGMAVLNFVIGTGMQCKVTRDAEDGGTNPPRAPTPGSWQAGSSAMSLNATGIYPATPLRAAALVPHTFRINAQTRPGRTFIVRMNDGYSTTFGPAASG